MSIVTQQLPPDLRCGSRRLEMEVEATLGTRHQLSPSLGTCTRAEVSWFCQTIICKRITGCSALNTHLLLLGHLLDYLIALPCVAMLFQ